MDSGQVRVDPGTVKRNVLSVQRFLVFGVVVASVLINFSAISLFRLIFSFGLVGRV